MHLRARTFRPALAVLSLSLALSLPVQAGPKLPLVERCTNVLEHEPVPSFVSGEKIIPLPKAGESKEAYEDFLRDRYGFKRKDLVWGKKYPLLVHGGDEASFVAKADFEHAVKDAVEYDAVIVGGGPAGITAGIYLTDAGKKVLILEKETTLGGLASGGSTAGVRYGRGAAYFTSMEGEIYEAYKHMGFGLYKKDFTIRGSTDSYYWNGKFYHDIWENEKTMEELPQSFNLFKYYLKHADEIGLIPTQPFDEFPNLLLDTMTMKQWVNTFPEEMKKLAVKDPKAKKIYEKFLADPNVPKDDPMAGPLGLLDLYGRSALGDHADKISAAGFANFYVSELDTRYTGNLGTGSPLEKAVNKLKKRHSLVNLKTSAPLAKIRTTPNGVEVYYVQNGVTYFAKAKDAVYSAQVRTAVKTIEDFDKIAPEQFQIAKDLKYRNYLVVNAHVEGHPWKASYDTWVRDDKIYSQNEFTDIIDGRWQDFRGEELPRNDNRGVLTIYDPLPEEEIREGMTVQHMAERTEEALDKMKGIIEATSAAVGENGKVNVLAAEVNRWPISVHVTEPGHFSKKAKILKRPVGNIHFANNNLGTPAIEEAVYDGYEAAKAILAKQGVEKNVVKPVKPKAKTTVVPKKKSAAVATPVLPAA